MARDSTPWKANEVRTKSAKGLCSFIFKNRIKFSIWIGFPYTRGPMVGS